MALMRINKGEAGVLALDGISELILSITVTGLGVDN